MSPLFSKVPNQFLRELCAFRLDHGHEVGHAFKPGLGREGMLGRERHDGRGDAAGHLVRRRRVWRGGLGTEM